MRRMFDWIGEKWECEPAAFVGVAHALLLVAAAFGLKLTAEQVAALGALSAALGALVVRSQVSPK